MKGAMLAISELTVCVGKKRVLDRFSLSIDPGEHVLVTAPSGAGKSTLLRCVLGFATPVHGTIHVQGSPIRGNATWDLRRHMGYLAQEPALGRGTVREVLARPFTYRANRHAEANLGRRLPGLLDRLRLPSDIVEQEIQTLSGGEKQRIALIAVLLLDRPLLLLDEISAGLDHDSAEAVFSVLTELSNRTILAVGHHASAMPGADRIETLPAYPATRGGTP